MSNIDFNRFLQRLSSVSEQTFIDPAILEWPEAVDPTTDLIKLLFPLVDIRCFVHFLKQRVEFKIRLRQLLRKTFAPNAKLLNCHLSFTDFDSRLVNVLIDLHA